MTASDPTTDRDLVPRWRTFGSTVRARETESFERVNGGDRKPADIEEQERNFAKFPGLAAAADLVGAALVLGVKTDSTIRAAEMLTQDPTSSESLVELGRSLLDEDGSRPEGWDSDDLHTIVDVEGIRRRAHNLRAVLRREPRNAVRWTDLALAHTVLGNTEHAEQDMRIALKLAGTNRFVLRAAVSLYVHLGQPDVAHRLITRDLSLLSDPWIAAAEIATAEMAGRSPKSVRTGGAILRDGRGPSPWHSSELASELAMVEVRAGHSRPARRLMELALREPTDNAAAQAEWAKIHGLITVAEPLDLSLPRTFEARSRRSAAEGKWSASVHDGMRWIADQPFAVEAARFTSYVAAVGAEDYVHSELASRAGLIANGSDRLLRNNLVFALANQDKLEEAQEQFGLIDRDGLDTHELSVLTATEGFLRFRHGSPTEGRVLYRRAVDAALRAKREDVARLASIFWAREELLSPPTTESSSALGQALAVAGDAEDEIVRLWWHRLLEIAQTQHRTDGPG